MKLITAFTLIAVFLVTQANAHPASHLIVTNATRYDLTNIYIYKNDNYLGSDTQFEKICSLKAGESKNITIAASQYPLYLGTGTESTSILNGNTRALTGTSIPLNDYPSSALCNEPSTCSPTTAEFKIVAVHEFNEAGIPWLDYTISSWFVDPTPHSQFFYYTEALTV